MNNSDVSFTSRIQFVDGRTFAKYNNKGFYIGFNHQTSNMLKAPKFFSCDIRTCTGGGITDKNGNALGFHFWDDKPNKKNFQDIIVKMFRWMPDADRGLLVGSKDLGKYSIEQFQRFKYVFNARLKNLTLFEKHRHLNSGTSYIYEAENDTWTLSTNFIKNGNNKYVKTLEDLKEAFENIKIADGDELYINGKRIAKEEAPELFE